MADNITPPAVAVTLATDDIGGVHYPKSKIAFGANDSATDVSPTNPFPVVGTAAYKTVTPWDGSALDASAYGEVIVNISGISGGDSYAIKGSITGANPRTLLAINLADLTTTASITADGIYSFPAVGIMTFVKTGAASAPTVHAMLKQ